MVATTSPNIWFETSPAQPGSGLKVLVVTNMFPTPAKPHLGVFVREQVESLRALGLHVDVLFMNGPASKLNYLRGLLAFWRQVRKTKYDVVHAHYVHSGWIARMQAGTPVITTFHSGEFYSGKLEYWLTRLLAPRIDGVILVSNMLRKFLPGQKAWVIPCGIDTQRFRPIPQAEARARLGLPGDRKLVLFAAARRPEKRFDLVERACELLERERPDAELLIVSGQPPERIPLYMNACDVLVLASDKEGSPQVIKEAMACNLPIVSVPVGDVEEVISGTEGCYLCTQDPADIAAKLKQALDRGARTRGREAVAHLALDKVASRLVEVYQQVLRPRESSQANTVSTSGG